MTNELALIPEETTLWREADLWGKDIAVRTGVGYKDNVLLSPGPRQGSGFFTSGLDLSIYRLPLDRLEFNLTVTGDDVRYFRNVGINNEDAFVASAQVKGYLGGGWQTGLEFRESYIDQFEYVILQSGPEAAQIKGNVLLTRPFVRRNLGTNWWIQVDAEITRELFGAPLDDCWRYGPRLSLGRSFALDSAVSLSYGGFYETHDTLPATDSSGNTLPGTKRAFWKQDAALKWDKYWDAQKHWHSTLGLGFQYVQDNGGGFFNYYAYSASAELRYQDKDWQLKAGGHLTFQDYPVQHIVPDILATPTLQRTPSSLSVFVQRRIYKSLKIYARYDYETTFSNLASDQYHANTATGGLSCSF